MGGETRPFNRGFEMKKFIALLLGLLIAGPVSAASIKEDMTAQGNQSYLHRSVTAQMWSATFRDYEDSTAVNTLLYSECGKTLFLNSGTEFATTLPAPVAGCTFKFIVQAAPVGTAYTIVTPAGGNLIDGTTVVNGGVIGCVDEDTITFTASAAISGDWVSLMSDGTNWYVTGQAFAATGIACTAT